MRKASPVNSPAARPDTIRVNTYSSRAWFSSSCARCRLSPRQDAPTQPGSDTPLVYTSSRRGYKLNLAFLRRGAGRAPAARAIRHAGRKKPSRSCGPKGLSRAGLPAGGLIRIRRHPQIRRPLAQHGKELHHRQPQRLLHLADPANRPVTFNPLAGFPHRRPPPAASNPPALVRLREQRHHVVTHEARKRATACLSTRP